MASLRRQIVEQFIERISGLRIDGKPFLGSVNDLARAPDQVNDAPSVDVLSGTEQRTLRASWMADRDLQILVRIWNNNDSGYNLDDLVEMVEDVIRSEPTLGGLVIHVACTDIETDEGWLAMQGYPSIADVRFTAHWEAEET